MAAPEIGERSRCQHCRQPIVYDRFMSMEGPATWRHLTSDKPPLLKHLRSRPSCAACGTFFAAPSPDIIVLCGSTRFYTWFQRANYELTMQGHIVLSVGFYPHASDEAGHGEGVGHDSPEKIMLDELHKRKIDLADRVLVLNVGGYIGDSTRSEIEYAIDHNVPVEYLEDHG